MKSYIWLRPQKNLTLLEVATHRRQDKTGQLKINNYLIGILRLLPILATALQCMDSSQSRVMFMLYWNGVPPYTYISHFLSHCPTLIFEPLSPPKDVFDWLARILTDFERNEHRIIGWSSKKYNFCPFLPILTFFFCFDLAKSFWRYLKIICLYVLIYES